MKSVPMSDLSDPCLPRQRSNPPRRDSEGGYVIATTALLLIPLMIFAAFATDVGGWYVRSQEVQRASDAAALAAVVWMPDIDAAERAAVEVAALNGFPDQTPAGVDNDPLNLTDLSDFDDPDAPLPQVKVTPLGGQQVMVEIRAEGDIYFGGVAGVDEIDITRFASAEYVLPVPMGNPTSAIGTGDIDIGGQQMYWLNAHADCFGATAGDLLNSANLGSVNNGSGGGAENHFDGNSPSGCAPNGSNPSQEPRGYTYVIDKPPGVQVTVQAHHVGRCKRPWWEGTSRGEQHGGNTPALDFTLYAADNTPLLDLDNLVPANVVGATQLGGGRRSDPANESSGPDCPVFRSNLNPLYDPGADGDNVGVDDEYWAPDAGEYIDPNWQSVFTIPAAATPGRWFLTVATPPGSTGHKNLYSLRLLGSNFPSGAEVCSTLIPSSVTSGICPTITALDRFGIYIGENTARPDLSPSAASFYFAEVEEIHAGKTMEINLWDAAEGSDFLQFIDPQGDAVEFRYRTTNIAGGAASGWTNVSGTCPTNVEGNGQPCLDVNGGGFASEFLIIEIELPNNYSCNTTDCWWRVRYGSLPGGQVDDSTTWSVRIVGDPVRLIE
jgi:hypothetical protein